MKFVKKITSNVKSLKNLMLGIAPTSNINYRNGMKKKSMKECEINRKL